MQWGQPREIWIDVGTHLGECTFTCARINPSITVYAFEPDLRLVAQLAATSANFVVSNFVLLPMAVAEQDGCADFHINASDGCSSLLPLSEQGCATWIGGQEFRVESKICVPTIRLDTFMRQMGISQVDFLKIDAQGADLSVVKSAGDRLACIKKITLEVAVAPRSVYVIAYLSERGFVLVCSERQTYDQEENLTFERR